MSLKALNVPEKLDPFTLRDIHQVDPSAPAAGRMEIHQAFCQEVNEWNCTDQTDTTMLS